MKNLLTALVAAVFFPTLGNAQNLPCGNFPILYVGQEPCPVEQAPRVTVDVGYTLGNLEVTRKYPNKSSLINGESFASDGLDVSAKVRITDIVTVGYRHEHAGLRNAMLMATKTMGSNRPYQDFVDGKTQYRELYGSFALRGTRGHALIIGIASTSMEYDVEYQVSVFAPPLPGLGEKDAVFLGTKTVDAWFRTSYLGFVIGGEGSRKIGKMTFDYSGRWHPRSVRKNDRESSAKENEYKAPDQTSRGKELRGGATWNFDEHVGLNVTGELQRLKTAGENRHYIDEYQTIKKVTVGVRLSF